jgi:ATP-dependent Lon protease
LADLTFHTTPEDQGDAGFEEIPILPVDPEEQGDTGVKSIPHEIGVLPLANTVVFPYLVVPLHVNRPGSIQLIDDALVGSRVIGLFTQRNNEDPEELSPDVFEIGTAANILKMLRHPDGSMMVLVQGICRVRILQYAQKKPYPKVRVAELPIEAPEGIETTALARNLQEQFTTFISLVPSLSDELRIALTNTHDPSKLADFIISNLNLKVEEKQELLGMPNVVDRMHRLTELLTRELQVAQLGSQIQNKVQSEIGKNQRDYILREQIKAIRRELGEDDGEDLSDLEDRLQKARMPERPKQAADREMARLRRMSPNSAEYTVSRTYVEWLLDVPWNTATKDILDLAKAQKILDEDHYDLEKVKDRILEFLAVRKLTDHPRGPILCFAGAPGVGKTSLGQSIARAMGRKFVRMSLGGVRDEAEIRGHRRTYIGALPGRIIQGLKTVGTSNPVFMLDEVDKLGADFRGDPASALLEVLDPEQNHSFEDHYLDVPVDLSHVLFIATANVLETIPRALLDRMELIRIAGYTIEQKVAIAKRHLIPKVLKNNGLSKGKLEFTDTAIQRAALEYTREVGLRNLERELSTIGRKVARKVAEGRKSKQVVSPDRLEEFLGPPKFVNEVALRTATPGVATGMAWTELGGDILFVEATSMPGKGGLKLTGQLGQVMIESAQAAFSYLHSNCKSLKLPPSLFQKQDFHVHVPSGAIPKDGPSAGVTMASALFSLMTNKPVRRDLAMTGEITLRGQVLQIGGLKEKVLAAKLAGITHILIPKRNEKDLVELSDFIRDGLTFHFAETVEDVLRVAVDGKKSSSRRRKPAGRR